MVKRKLKIFFACLFVSQCLIGLTYAQVTPAGFWPLDGNANDASGNNLHGVVSGALPTADRNGNPGAAFAFDGINDHIALPGTEDALAFIQNTGTFTIAGYIRLADLDARSCIIGTAITSLNKGFLFWYENRYPNTRKLTFARYKGVEGVFDAAYGNHATINDNNWHHVAVVGEGKSIKFYVDGVLDGNSTTISNPSTNSSTWPGMIGSTRNAGGDYALPFNGNIDNLQIYKYSLTQQEIQDLINSGTTPDNHLVQGKTYFDVNKNGTFDAGDEPIDGIMVKAEPGNTYAISDHKGDYNLYLENGTYTLEQVIPNYKGKFIRQTSPDTGYTVQLSDTSPQQSGLDFGNHVTNAPFLSVDVSSTRFRRCMTNTTQVYYCNEGFATANNVKVVLEYPEYIIPISSSIPWKKNGKVYTFDIGSMEGQTCAFLTLTDSVVCGDESIRGLTQCIKASVIPRNSVINVHPNWDQSDIILSAQCRDNGFVRVVFKNMGTGAMADSANFNIYLEKVRVYKGKYKLNAGDTLGLNLLANGKTLHAEAALTPHHPENKQVSVSIKDCNQADGPQTRQDFSAYFSQNDESETIETACLPIVDSYDPNDKLVMPAGITSSNNIAEDAMLEYTIRFQNTGSDVAYNIVIEDPLSEYLDLATLKVGLSSHPVQWELSKTGQPTLIWRFKNINLPDSTSNEKGSHGFVKFQIKPYASAGKGTIIKNHASIYFDYNSPIITNEVTNTLGLPEILQQEKIQVQNCNSRISMQPEADLTVSLCEEDRYELSRVSPGVGHGMWKVTKGAATLSDPYSNQTTATNLSVGENEFSWEVTYCDQNVSSKISIHRAAPLEKPAVASSVAVCEGEPIAAIPAKGEGLEWYADAALTQLLATGASYQPTGKTSETLYVVQRREACVSQPSAVSVVVQARLNPPISSLSQEGCVDIAMPVLSAKGSNVRWYADAQKQKLLAEGSEFTPTNKSSQTYYATQSSEHCESDAVAVNFKAKRFDPEKAYIANVVIPDGKKDNQRYWIKDFEGKECLGDFISIKIYNRWGEEIFESRKSDFKWDASQLPSGVYYYQMHYQLQPFYGHIQVLK